MSADNWAICPVCKIKKEAAIEKAHAHAREQYGKASAEQYLSILATARNLESSLTDTSNAESFTLREDYEVGIDRDGLFSMSYVGSCDKCHFHYSSTTEVRLDVKEFAARPKNRLPEKVKVLDRQ